MYVLCVSYFSVIFGHMSKLLLAISIIYINNAVMCWV